MSIHAENLMEEVSAQTVTGKEPDEAFQKAMADFAIRLFTKTQSDDRNSLLSPASVLFALAMSANGAEGETLAQMERLFGEFPLAELNEYLYRYRAELFSEKSCKVHLTNSVWFRDTFEIRRTFLQKNADYYGASAYRSAFDQQTVKDINLFIKQNTDGLVDRIVDSMDPQMQMFLINTVLFDAKWQTNYRSYQVRNGEFTQADGTKRTVPMMHSTEHVYLQGTHFTGFVKPYAGRYSFVALLPEEGMPLSAFLASLTGEKWVQMMQAAKQDVIVNATLPKFDYADEMTLNQALQQMGMTNAFSPEQADFSGISPGPLYLAKVLHKTRIIVDENGTKAGAVTSMAYATCSAPPIERYTVRLDRPFVYAIIDNETQLPLFFGALTQVSK